MTAGWWRRWYGRNERPEWMPMESGRKGTAQQSRAGQAERSKEKSACQRYRSCERGCMCGGRRPTSDARQIAIYTTCQDSSYISGQSNKNNNNNSENNSSIPTSGARTQSQAAAATLCASESTYIYFRTRLYACPACTWHGAWRALTTPPLSMAAALTREREGEEMVRERHIAYITSTLLLQQLWVAAVDVFWINFNWIRTMKLFT